MRGNKVFNLRAGEDDLSPDALFATWNNKSLYTELFFPIFLPAFSRLFFPIFLPAFPRLSVEGGSPQSSYCCGLGEHCGLISLLKREIFSHQWDIEMTSTFAVLLILTFALKTSTCDGVRPANYISTLQEYPLNVTTSLKTIIILGWSVRRSFCFLYSVMASA